MSEFSIAMACLGGVVLAGVVAHGTWQARKAGPLRPVQPPPTEPREPVLVVDPPVGEASVEPVLLDGQPALEPSVPVPEAEDDAAPVVPPPRRPSARIDALIDAIATLAVEAPVSGDMALAHLPPARRAGSKPLLIEGQNAESGEWEPLRPGQRYRELQAGVQLANRTGALNEIEYSEFVQKVQAYADLLGAMADFPDMLDAVARARELDSFAGQHDAHLAVHLHARGTAWSVGYIHQHAARSGFVPGLVPGRLVLPSLEEGAPPTLTLAYDPQAALAEDPNQSAVHVVTLSFDVPQTPASAAPFDTWQASAQALAEAMEAVIVDDHRQPLGPQSFEAIGGELGQLYEALERRDLAAGSMAARRLFS